ncbi:MAG: bifunctional glutamate N-acetyltransferase/amino-acid acetyltransferase ArgJ, partial [Proteobacteria bacterium]|nr:bifunctional glutamate N-acetyltransferase/amino-acid acetyltransferase ArgJ [Pseudomonadota bacterium]
VLVASTGVIGEHLEMDCFSRGVPKLVEKLSADGLTSVSLAIMTTDTVPKTAVREFAIAGRKVRIAGLAKGAGMIRPDMATMLCFVLTDGAVAGDFLRSALKSAVDRSFNRITVDGDTSTNDSVLIMANGLAGNEVISQGSGGAELFQGALDDLLTDLALQVVRDGEGATKLVRVEVKGAVSELEARKAAHTVADSKLVKTAFFGEDANWGRIIAALGRSGAAFDPEKVDIFFDGVQMVRDGLGLGKKAEAAATEILRKKEFTVSIDLKAGTASAIYYTCDLSIDYVKINADYRS